jgi:hypothetical protein
VKGGDLLGDVGVARVIVGKLLLDLERLLIAPE